MIRRLLVANRGEIARRVFAACRAAGIGTVAVYSDADAHAPHVAEADLAVRLPGNAAADTYLRGEKIVAAARAAGADAVHPGYGFLSENAEFAAAVIDAGLTWVGPPPKAIAIMGAKLEAKTLLAGAGVPMLPSATDPEQVTEFPVLVKASAGGGGRGMRVVREAADLPAAIAAARREAAAAFGDGTVFCERYVEPARHVEVQILADGYGRVLALGERECSIQRRHQKIIEESPSPGVDAAADPDLRRRLCDAAVAAASAVGYTGAGTVEFLLAPDGRFYFLEMNTRLQVEHPVTEMVYGIDLVAWQLRIAEGARLPESPPAPRGHAIEVRLYAEDPAAGWRPATGTVHGFDIPGVTVAFGPSPATGGIGDAAGGFAGTGGAGEPLLRLDSGVAAGSTVDTFYDPMLAKVIAWAPDRAGAARLLSGALARTAAHGPTTNRDLLVRTLRHPEFLAGTTDTGFLDRNADVFAPLADEATVRLSCLAAALAGAAARREAATVQAGLPSGWRNVGPSPQVVGFDAPGGPVEVRYAFDRTGTALVSWSATPSVATDPAARPTDPAAAIDPDATEAGADGVRLLGATAGEVLLEIAGVRTAFVVRRVGDVSYVDSPGGSVTVTELPRFPAPGARIAPGSLVAPLPGTVGRVVVAAGQRVAAGDLLLTLEAMKLEHPVHAPAAGVVAALPVAPGTQVEAGAVLAVITPDDSQESQES